MISTAKTTLRMLMADVNFVQSVALLAARIWVAKVFFYSGLTKIKTWDSTLTLFEYEYAVPVLPTEVAAYMATAGELILPVLLVFGLFTPVAALGLFIMTLVIEFLVYPGTTEHYYWMLLLGILMTHGSGKLGLDHFIKKKFL